jgi:hypothetical protein
VAARGHRLRDQPLHAHPGAVCVIVVGRRRRARVLIEMRLCSTTMK